MNKIVEAEVLLFLKIWWFKPRLSVRFQFLFFRGTRWVLFQGKNICRLFINVE